MRSNERNSSQVELIDLENKKRRRDSKFDSKDLLQVFPFGSGLKRKTSLDLDYLEKIKSSDLRNILR